MSLYLALKALHIVGATVLLGTGAGIAFFMLMAHRTADALFTATAVVLQPMSGAALAAMAGYPLLHGWVALSLALYVLVGVFWLPVVWMQLRMRDLARAAAAQSAALPAAYHRLWRLWFACGIPAFTGVLAIIWLMTAKPSL